MLIFLLDFETTSLNKETGGICEYAIALWDTVMGRVIRTFDSLVYDPDVKWDPEVEQIHGLTPKLVESYGMPTDKAYRQFTAWANSADVFCAYNGKSFDFSFWDAWATKNGGKIPERLRLDPMVDIQWPKHWSRELFYIAAKHGIINHFQHSGIGDVLTMMEILNRHSVGGHKCQAGSPKCNVTCDLGTILEYAKMPEIVIEGICHINDRDRVKSNGFHWLYPPSSNNKHWIKTIKEGLLDQEIELGKKIGYLVKRIV